MSGLWCVRLVVCQARGKVKGKAEETDLLPEALGVELQSSYNSTDS